MPDRFADDVAGVASIGAVPAILEMVCKTTGMGFATVAKAIEGRWIVCSVCDNSGFGLRPGGELEIDSLIGEEIARGGQAVIVDDFGMDSKFPIRRRPGSEAPRSCILMPINLSEGRFFGVLCACDPEPLVLNTPEKTSMFEMFANVIGFQLNAADTVTNTKALLLEEARTSTLREEFLAVLGHDLRNPLTGILGGMEMLQKNPLTERAAQWAKMIVASAERMAVLIDLVMDFSRSRLGGGLTLERGVHDEVEPMLQQIVADLRMARGTRDIEAAFDVGEPVYCDLKRLAQLVSNLLGNAVTHGDAGTPVRVAATAVDGWFEFEVGNGCEPIAEPLLSRIFEPFSRGSVQSASEGLGLGLYISRQIALAHGGDLRVSSTIEETRFTFRMPLRRPA